MLPVQYRFGKCGHCPSTQKILNVIDGYPLPNNNGLLFGAGTVEVVAL